MADFQSKEKFMSKYGHLSHNWHEDLVNRLGGEEMAEAFKRGVHPLQLASIHQLDFRMRVKAVTAKQVLERLPTSGWVQSDVLKAAHQSQHGEVKLVFVRSPGDLRVPDTSDWLRDRGLQFVDPVVHMVWNAEQPDFVNSCPNFTQFEDGHLGICHTSVCLGVDRTPRLEMIRTQFRSWGSNWWLAGTPIN